MCPWRLARFTMVELQDHCSSATICCPLLGSTSDHCAHHENRVSTITMLTAPVTTLTGGSHTPLHKVQPGCDIFDNRDTLCIFEVTVLFVHCCKRYTRSVAHSLISAGDEGGMRHHRVDDHSVLSTCKVRLHHSDLPELPVDVVLISAP